MLPSVMLAVAVAIPRAGTSSLRQVAVVALLASTLAASAAGTVVAASPEPSGMTAGDPRSAGVGPGFIGDAPLAIGATIALGIGAAVCTYIYVRLTKRKDES